MKRLIAVVLIAIMVIALVPNVASAAKPDTDFSGTHYNLNLIGKKADWSGGGTYSNPDRHTMFVPEDTSTFSYVKPDGTVQTGSIQIQMTQGSDWEVLDGNAFDDGKCSFQLAPGKYNVYIVSKAKPGYTTDINAWVYYYDPITNFSGYYLNVGSINVTRKWQDATSLFYVSPQEDQGVLGITDSMWVFDYLDALTTAGYTNTMYYWDYDNYGNKLVQVRFYPQ